MTLNAMLITVLEKPNRIVIRSQGLLVTASIMSENTVQIVVRTVEMFDKIVATVAVVIPYTLLSHFSDLLPPRPPTKRSTRFTTIAIITRIMGTPITGLSINEPKIVGNKPRNHVNTEFA